VARVRRSPAWLDPWREVMVRLFIDARGQDLIEHGLLAATVGIGSIGVLRTLITVMGSTYSGWLSGLTPLFNSTPNPGS
jgi:Flp pilus assembly pilin Flp